MYRKVLAAALTATMVGGMFSTVAGAQDAKEYSDLDNRSVGDYIMGYFDRRSAEDNL